MMTQSKGGLFSPGSQAVVHHANPLWWAMSRRSHCLCGRPTGAKAPKQAGTETKPCRVDMVTLWAPWVACTKLLVGGEMDSHDPVAHGTCSTPMAPFSSLLIFSLRSSTVQHESQAFYMQPGCSSIAEIKCCLSLRSGVKPIPLQSSTIERIIHKRS